MIDPVSLSVAPNRVDIFHRGNDHALWHKWFDGNAWNGWEFLGGQLQSEPAVVSRNTNHIEVFFEGVDHNLWLKTWDGSRWLDL